MIVMISILELGMIYGIMSLGMYITYRILDFPDLTVDGSFPLGAAVTVILISKGVNPYLTLPISFGIGVIAGTLTGLIHVKLKVRDLLAGIIMMTGLYSVNLAIAGRANVPIYNMATIFENTLVDSICPGIPTAIKSLLIIAVITLLVKCLLDAYLRTKSGFLLRGVGDNDTLITSLGIDKGKVKIIGLALANGLVALSGCIFAQEERFFDISIGTGTAVIGLASVIIGTGVLKKITFFKATTGVIIGSICYRICIALAIQLKISSTYSKLITAILFLGILVISRDRKKVK